MQNRNLKWQKSDYFEDCSFHKMQADNFESKLLVNEIEYYDIVD